MVININLLSVSASFDFTANKPAIGGKQVVEANEVVVPHEESGTPRTSTSNQTKIDQDVDMGALGAIDWIAGVGDVCNGASKHSTTSLSTPFTTPQVEKNKREYAQRNPTKPLHPHPPKVT